MEYYMLLVTLPWLKLVVKTVISLLNNTDLCYEVREGKYSESTNLESNVKNLTDLFNLTVRVLLDTSKKCPQSLRIIFQQIRKSATKKFPDDEDIGYTCITSFLFLRLFVPVIMNPKLFNLVREYANDSVERALKLLATLLQKLANFQTFESHEAHLDQLNPVLERYNTSLKKFIDTLCDPHDNTSTVSEESTATGSSSSTHDSETDDDVHNSTTGSGSGNAVLLKLHKKPTTLVDQSSFLVSLARILKFYTSNMELLTQTPPDKTISKFLVELDNVTEEAKFLGKKFKTDQRKRRELTAQHTAPKDSPRKLKLSRSPASKSSSSSPSSTTTTTIKRSSISQLPTFFKRTGKDKHTEKSPEKSPDKSHE
eukprot:TRINITY_DN4078_c1_g1_i2.p1 TRINITY_DN4078_c1_g1~~TRINITY_DN4078_c1_g1_i2.p1  ORF type:complete len:369 (-),score=103.79 TRINITY_DN4078_c1_g1_i2:157-1263(-)